VDERISAMAKERNFLFVDNWADFYGNVGLYRNQLLGPGGVLSVKGLVCLETKFAAACKKLKNN